MPKIKKSRIKIDRNAESEKIPHLQPKGRILRLEKKCSVLEDKISEFQGEKADIEELRERMDNTQRGLKNLWRAFKESQNQKAS